jgi:hypothetical protein
MRKRTDGDILIFDVSDAFAGCMCTNGYSDVPNLGVWGSNTGYSLCAYSRYSILT